MCPSLSLLQTLRPPLLCSPAMKAFDNPPRRISLPEHEHREGGSPTPVAPLAAGRRRGEMGEREDVSPFGGEASPRSSPPFGASG